jgi:hypothetical protein
MVGAVALLVDFNALICLDLLLTLSSNCAKKKDGHGPP